MGGEAESATGWLPRPKLKAPLYPLGFSWGTPSLSPSPLIATSRVTLFLFLSVFSFLFLFLTFPSILLAFSPRSQPLLNSPPSFVCWSRGFMEMDRRVELVESLKKFCASTRLPPTPLLLFPEEEATNGREGLLRFRWVSAGIWLQLSGCPSSFPVCPLLALPSKFLIPQLSAYGVGQFTSLSQI